MQETTQDVEALQKTNEEFSTTRHIPNEVLATIFTYACAPVDFKIRECCRLNCGVPFIEYRYDEDDPREFRKWPPGDHPLSNAKPSSPVRLGAICTLWREVSWSTPELWTSLVIKLSPDFLAEQLEVLRLYQTNVGTRSLSLEIDLRAMHRYPRSQEPELVQSISDLVFGELSRQTSLLWLSGAPSHWTKKFSTTSFPKLEQLSFGWNLGAASRPPNFRLNLLGAAKNDPPVIPVNIRIVRLHHVCASICANILLLAPWLEEFYAIDTRRDDDENDVNVWLSKPFSCANLKKFGWCIQADDEWNEALLRYLELPNLESISLGGLESLEGDLDDDYDSDSDMRQILLNFLLELPETVKTLEFYHFFNPIPATEDCHDNLLHAIAHLPDVETVRLNYCSEDFIGDFLQILSVRAPRRHPRMKKQQVVVPLLKNIAIINPLRGERDNKLLIAYQFTEMLMERGKRSELGYLRWDWTGDCICWDVIEVPERLRKLAHEGARVEIFENHEPVII